MGRPLSERFERSTIGQIVISGAIVLVLACVIGTHLPPSALQRATSEPAGEIVRLLGSEQAWGVFAPNPRSISIGLEAQVTFADGTTTTWTLPDGPALGANLRYYRWRKWLERVRADAYRGIWAPTAEWIAGLYDDQPSPVVRVDLVRRFHENHIEGPQPEWEEFTYYTLELPEAEG
jgi:hypothetical protein